MPRKPRRRRIPESTWAELRACYFSGGELRALARTARINENTVLGRAMREQWSQQRAGLLSKVQASRADTQPDMEHEKSGAISAVTRETLLDRHLANMVSLSFRLSDHAAGLPVADCFRDIRLIDCLDRLTRRQLGLDKTEPLVSFGFFSSLPEAGSLGVVIDEEAEEAENPALEAITTEAGFEGGRMGPDQASCS